MSIKAEIEDYLIKLAKGADFSLVLHDLVRIIEKQCPEMRGLILLLDEGGKHLHLGAAVSLPDDYLQSIEGLEIGPMVGSCGTASYFRKRVIVEDIITDSRWDGLRHLAVKYGFRACWSQPVFSSEGILIGTFAMYYDQPRKPKKSELRAIETAAYLAGVSIESHQLRTKLFQSQIDLEKRVEERTTQLEQAQEALRRNEKKYRELVENANSIILEMDTQGRIIFFNRFAQEFFGFSETAIIGCHVVGTIVPPIDSTGRDLRQFIDDVLRQPEKYPTFDNENMSSDGRIVWIAWTNKPIYDERGRLSEILCIGIDRTEQKLMEQMITEELTNKVAADERNRLARDLHDAVSQTLFSISLISEVLPEIWAKNQSQGRDRLEEIRQLSKGALAEMRTLLLELRPTTLEDTPISELLKQLCDSISGRANLKIKLTVNEGGNFPVDVKIAFYRIAQEALNNIAKHAGADRAEVKMDVYQDQVNMIITDSGRGFDLKKITPNSLGIGIMRERALKIGVLLVIKSRKNQGTNVRLVWKKPEGGGQK